MKTTGEGQTRRGFMATIGVGAAALAVPAVATSTGRTAGFAAGTWHDAVGSWPSAVATMQAQTDAIVAQFRPAYLAEVERLAEELRPRFEAGDLRLALANRDGDEVQEAKDRLEAVGAERFGVKVERTRDADGFLVDEGNEVLGSMICAFRPS